jgi:L-alanine-DL-glutamate epimerase-like enolase superfamily enzyme
VLQVGTNAGGITGGLMVADLAYAFEIPISVMNSPGTYLAHFAAVLPNHIWIEVLNAGRTTGMTVDTRIEDGWIVLGDSPGLGITFDEAKLEELAVDESLVTQTALPAGRRRGAGLYEVGTDEADEIETE